MTFQILQTGLNASQDDVFELGGAMPFSVETLSSAMNYFWESTSLKGRWAGEGVAPPLTLGYRDVVSILSQSAPWIAHMRDQTNRIGHFVVVASQIHDEVEILDPAIPGTSYSMGLDNFLDYWNYQVVHLKGNL